MRGAHNGMPMPARDAIEAMAKGYPVRPETAPRPECHECGSQRLSQGEHGMRRCLDCNAQVVADPFEASLP